MGVRGITGALMAGPMEQTKLVPFAYDQVRQRNLDLEASRGQGMETTLELQNAMDALGSIPGTEDDAEALTKPFQDRLDKIHEQYGNDLGRAAPDLQKLAFDFMSNKSKESKELTKAGSSRASLQANIDEMITAGTLDSKTGAAYLQRATAQFNNSLDAYKKGEGEMYSGNVFNGTPVAKPDIKEDIFKIQPLIKPSSYESYGYISAGKYKDENGNMVTKYVEGTTEVEYSDAEVRARLTANMLKSLGYGEYADQQVSLGLAGPGYDGSGLMGIEKKINPLLADLSSDSKTSKRQIKAAGASSSREYLQMQGLEKARVQSMHKKKIAAAVEEYDMTPEEAENALADAQWKGLLSDGVIDDIAEASRIGAFNKQSISVKTPPKPEKEQKYEIPFEERPFTPGSNFSTVDMNIGTGAGKNSNDLKESIDSKIALVGDKESEISSPNTSQERVAVLTKEVKALKTAIGNEEKTYVPFKVADLLQRVDRGKLTANLEKVGLSLRGTEKVSPKEVEEATEKINKELVSYYNLGGIYGERDGKTDVSEFTGDMSFALAWDDATFKFMSEDPNKEMPSGVKLADIKHMVKDVRTKFARFSDYTALEKSSDYFVPERPMGGQSPTPEWNRVQSRAASITAGHIRPTDPLNENTFIGDVNKGELSVIARDINAKFGGENSSQLWAPQTYFAGYFDGKPSFIMDMAYYADADGGDPKRIPDNLLSSFTYGGETFQEFGGKRLVHLGSSTGVDAVADLAKQKTREISSALKAKDYAGAQEASEESLRLMYDLDYIPQLQGTNIESALSEDFTQIEGTDEYIGTVSRELPARFWEKIKDVNNLDEKGQPTVIYDPSKQTMNVEKTTYPDGREEYSIFFLESLVRETGDKVHNRDYLQKRGQKAWGNLSDLIFGVKNGEALAQEKYESVGRSLMQPVK